MQFRHDAGVGGAAARTGFSAENLPMANSSRPGAVDPTASTAMLMPPVRYGTKKPCSQRPPVGTGLQMGCRPGDPLFEA